MEGGGLVSTDTTEWQLQIPSTVSRNIIGKKGHVIRELQRQSDTTITLNRKNDSPHSVLTFQHARMHIPSLAKAVSLTLTHIDASEVLKLQFPILRGIDAEVENLLNQLSMNQDLAGVISYTTDDDTFVYVNDAVVLEGTKSIIQRAMFAVLEQVLEMDMKQYAKTAAANSSVQQRMGGEGVAPAPAKPSWLLAANAKCTPTIVGKSGNTIRRLEAKSGAKINITTEATDMEAAFVAEDAKKAAIAMALTLSEINDSEKAQISMPSSVIRRTALEAAAKARKLGDTVELKLEGGVASAAGPVPALRSLANEAFKDLLASGPVRPIFPDATQWAAAIPVSEVGHILGRGKAGRRKQELQDATSCAINIDFFADVAMITVTPNEDAENGVVGAVRAICGVLKTVAPDSHVAVQFPLAEKKEKDDEGSAPHVAAPLTQKKLKAFVADEGDAPITAYSQSLVLLSGETAAVGGRMLDLFAPAAKGGLADLTFVDSPYFIELPKAMAGPTLKSMQAQSDGRGWTATPRFGATSVTVHVAHDGNGGIKDRGTCLMEALVCVTADKAVVQLPAPPEGADTPADVIADVPFVELLDSEDDAVLRIEGHPLILRAAVAHLLRDSYGCDLDGADAKWDLEVPRQRAGPVIGKGGVGLKAISAAHPDVRVAFHSGALLLSFPMAEEAAEDGARCSAVLATILASLAKLEDAAEATIRFTCDDRDGARLLKEAAGKGMAVAVREVRGDILVSGHAALAGRVALAVAPAAFSFTMPADSAGMGAFLSKFPYRWRVKFPKPLFGRLLGKGGKGKAELEERSGTMMTVQQRPTAAFVDVSPAKKGKNAAEDVRTVAAGAMAVLNRFQKEEEVCVVFDLVETLSLKQTPDEWLASVKEEVTDVRVGLDQRTRLEVEGSPGLVKAAVAAVLDAGGLRDLATYFASLASVQWCMEIPGASAGQLIGRAGTVAREIQSSSGASLRSTTKDDEATVILEGTVAEVAKAVIIATDKLDETTAVRLSFPPIGGSYTPVVRKRLDELLPSKVSLISASSASIVTGLSYDDENVSLKGTPLNIEQSLLAVLSKVFLLDTDVFQASASPDASAQWVLEMPRKFVGRVVGKGGRTLQQLQEALGVVIEIKYKKNTVHVALGLPPSATTPPIVGTEEAGTMLLVKAVRLVMDMLAEDTEISVAIPISDQLHKWLSRRSEVGGCTLTVRPRAVSLQGTCTSVLGGLLALMRQALGKEVLTLPPTLVSLTTSEVVLQVPNDQRMHIFGKGGRTKRDIQEASKVVLELAVKNVASTVTFAAPREEAKEKSAKEKEKKEDEDKEKSAKEKKEQDEDDKEEGKGKEKKDDEEDAAQESKEAKKEERRRRERERERAQKPRERPDAVGAMAAVAMVLSRVDEGAEVDLQVAAHVLRAPVRDAVAVAARAGLPHAVYQDEAIVITGTAARVRKVVMDLIGECMGAGRQAATLLAKAVGWSLTIPRQRLRALLGTAGATIQEIQSATGVTLDAKPTETVATVEFSVSVSGSEPLVAVIAALDTQDPRTEVSITGPRPSEGMVRSISGKAAWASCIKVQENGCTLQGSMQEVRAALQMIFADRLEGDAAKVKIVHTLGGRADAWVVQMPKDAAGFVIGRGGQRVKEMRAEAGCDMDVDVGPSYGLAVVRARDDDEAGLRAVVHGVALVIATLRDVEVSVQIPLVAAEGVDAEQAVKKAGTICAAVSAPLTSQCAEKLAILSGPGNAVREVFLDVVGRALGHPVDEARKAVEPSSSRWHFVIANKLVGFVIGKGGKALRELEKACAPHPVDVNRGREKTEVAFASAETTLDVGEGIVKGLLSRLDADNEVELSFPFEGDAGTYAQRFVVRPLPGVPATQLTDVFSYEGGRVRIVGPVRTVRVAVDALFGEALGRDEGVVECAVHQRYVGALIGRAGETVRALEAESSASISVGRTGPRGGAARQAQAEWASASVEGDAECVVDALNAIAKAIKTPVVVVMHSLGEEFDGRLDAVLQAQADEEDKERAAIREAEGERVAEKTGKAPEAGAAAKEDGKATAAVTAVPEEEEATKEEAAATKSKKKGDEPSSDIDSLSTSSSDDGDFDARAKEDFEAPPATAETFNTPAPAPEKKAVSKPGTRERLAEFLAANATPTVLMKPEAMAPKFASLLLELKLTEEDGEWLQDAIFQKASEESAKDPSQQKAFFAWTKVLTSTVMRYTFSAK